MNEHERGEETEIEFVKQPMLQSERVSDRLACFRIDREAIRVAGVASGIVELGILRFIRPMSICLSNCIRTYDHLPVLLLVGDLVGASQLGVGDAAEDEHDQAGQVLLRGGRAVLALVLVPLAVAGAENDRWMGIDEERALITQTNQASLDLHYQRLRMGMQLLPSFVESCYLA